MKRYFALLLALSLFSSKLMAEDFKFTDYNLGIGNLTQFVGKIQTDESGSKNKFDFLPFIQVSTHFNLIDNFKLIPELSITIPHKSNDKIVKKLIYIALANVGYEWRDFLFLAGAGMSFTRLTTSGGSQQLNNGAGFDSFPIPKGTRTSANIITHLGAHYYITKSISAKLGLHFYNLEDSDERAVSYTLGATYHFGNIFSSTKAE